MGPSRPLHLHAEMMLVWIMLLLHQGYALISVTTVALGERVTFTCLFQDVEYSNIRVKWFKQSPGDTLALITTLMKATVRPIFEEGFHPSRLHVNHTNTNSTLTIFSAIPADEALYHCEVSTWTTDRWTGSYLSIKGNTQRTSNYTVVERSTVSGSVRPGDSVTLQCSVLSESQTKTCPGGHSVFWFRAGSDKYHPEIVYTDGNDECEERSDSVKSCVYHFSKNISSSDAGTYRCAVATCGQILFGNGTKLDIEATSVLHKNLILPLLSAVLVVPVVAAAFYICAIKENKCDCCQAPDFFEENFAKGKLKRDDTWIYSTAVFTVVKTGSGGVKGPKAEDRERIYAAVKNFGLLK